MNFFSVFILSLIDMLMLFILIFSVYTDLYYKKRLAQIIAVLSGTVLISLLSCYVSNEAVDFTLNIFIVCFILWQMTELAFTKIIVLYSYCLSIVYGIQIVIALGMKYLFYDFNMLFSYGIIAQVLALIAIIGLRCFVDLRGGYEIIDSNRILKITVINIFVIFYLLVMKWYLDFSGFLESTISILLIVTVLFVINGVLFKDMLDKQNTKEKMMVYDMYLPVIEEMIEEMRSKQHDYHNHIQALECLNTACASNYKNKLIQNITWEKLMVLENKVLMAFLYSKYTLALKENIAINYKVKSTLLDVKCSDMELIELVGILIDNALEATLRKGHGHFDVLIDRVNGKTMIETRNASDYVTSKEINQMFEYNSSFKDLTGRGMGLYKLKKIINRGKGTITVYYDTIREMLVFSLELV